LKVFLLSNSFLRESKKEKKKEREKKERKKKVLSVKFHLRKRIRTKKRDLDCPFDLYWFPFSENCLMKKSFNHIAIDIFKFRNNFLKICGSL